MTYHFRASLADSEELNRAKAINSKGGFFDVGDRQGISKIPREKSCTGKKVIDGGAADNRRRLNGHDRRPMTTARTGSSHRCERGEERRAWRDENRDSRAVEFGVSYRSSAGPFVFGSSRQTKRRPGEQRQPRGPGSAESIAAA